MKTFLVFLLLIVTHGVIMGTDESPEKAEERARTIIAGNAAWASHDSADVVMAWAAGAVATLLGGGVLATIGMGIHNVAKNSGKLATGLMSAAAMLVGKGVLFKAAGAVAGGGTAAAGTAQAMGRSGVIPGAVSSALAGSVERNGIGGIVKNAQGGDDYIKSVGDLNNNKFAEIKSVTMKPHVIGPQNTKTALTKTLAPHGEAHIIGRDNRTTHYQKTGDDTFVDTNDKTLNPAIYNSDKLVKLYNMK